MKKRWIDKVISAVLIVMMLSGMAVTGAFAADSGVTNQPFDFYYRCINDNAPVVCGPSTAASYLAAGGGGKTTANNHYTAFKMSFPSYVTSADAVKSASIKLRSVDNRQPFALFYMPNENWDMSSGKNAMYNDTKTLSAAFNRWSTQSFADTYPDYDKDRAKNGDYETPEVAKPMLESAAKGNFKENYLGVFGLESEYNKEFLTIDVTAAVKRALSEGKKSLSLVISAPGTLRTQFLGVESGLSADQKASYSMTLSGGGSEQPGEVTREVLKTFFDDAVQNAWEQSYKDENGKATYVSRVVDSSTSHSGSASYRLKLQSDTTNGKMLWMNWVDNSSFNLDSYDADTTYLEFYYQPLLLRDRVEAGFICGDNPYASVRVDISRYVSITEADIASGAWKLVKIPLSDLKDSEKAVFADNGSGREDFDWSRAKGFTIAGSDENVTSQANFCRIDDVILVKDSQGGGEPEQPEQPEKPEREVLNTYFDDALQNAWEQSYKDELSSDYVSRVVDSSTSHSGSVSYRLKLKSAETRGKMLWMNWVSNGSLNLNSYDADTTYLEFYYQPLMLRNRVEAGFICGDNPYASVRVDISRYVTVTAADVESGAWKKVKIPLSDLKNDTKAVFDDNETGREGFDWSRSKGFTIAGSDEDIPNQVNFCRIDDVVLVKDTTKDPVFGVTAITFTDQDDKEITALPENGGEVRCTVKAENPETAKDLYVVLAYYDGTLLQGVTAGMFTVPNGGGSWQGSVTVPAGKQVRAFVWDAASLRPADGINTKNL